MTINLASLIIKVQSNLSDLPDSYLDDKQIYNDIKTANYYIQSIKKTTWTDEDFEAESIVRVASYYSYINYTSLAERQLGTLPPTSNIKAESLRTIALQFLKLISEYGINNDLSVNTEKESKSMAVAAINTLSVYDSN